MAEFASVGVFEGIVVASCASAVLRAAGFGLGGLGSCLRGGQEAFDGGRLVYDGRPYEGLVEHHGCELFVRHSAVVVVVGLPAVRGRRAPTSSGTSPE